MQDPGAYVCFGALMLLITMGPVGAHRSNAVAGARWMNRGDSAQACSQFMRRASKDKEKHMQYTHRNVDA